MVAAEVIISVTQYYIISTTLTKTFLLLINHDFETDLDNIMLRNDSGVNVHRTNLLRQPVCVKLELREWTVIPQKRFSSKPFLLKIKVPEISLVHEIG